MVLLILIVVIILFNILLYVLDPDYLKTTLPLVGPALIPLVLAYGISRTRHFRRGALLTVIVIMAVALVSGWVNPDYRTVGSATVGLGMLFASMFFSTRQTALIATVGWLGLAAGYVVFPGGENPSVEIATTLLVAVQGLAIVAWLSERNLSEQDRQQHDLIETERSFRDLLESGSDAIIIVDRQGRIVKANTQAEMLFGYAPSALNAQPIENLIPQDKRRQHVEDRAIYSTGPRARSMGAGKELSALRRDGSTFPAEISLTPIRGEDDLLVSTVITDISRRKESEEALRASEERFRHLVETAPGAILLADQQGQIVLVNQRLEAMFGYRRDELLGQPLDALLPGPVREVHRQHLATFFTHPEDRMMGAGRDLNGQRKDGSIFPVEIGLSQVATAGGVHVVAFVTDITERKYAEALTEQRANQLALLHTVGSQIVAMLDTRQLLNEAAKLIHSTFGYDYVGIFMPDHGTDRWIQRAKAGTLADLFPENFMLEPGQGIVGYVAQSGKEFLVNDVDGESLYFDPFDESLIKSELSVPIHDANEVVGVLDIRSRKSSAFSDSDLVVLRTLADQLSAALRNARLFEIEHRERTLAQALQQVTAGITSSDDLESALDLLMDNLMGIVPHAHAVILTTEDDGLKVAAASGDMADVYITGQMIEPAQVVAMKPLTSQDRWLWLRDTYTEGDSVPPLYTAQTRGWVGVPLVVSEVVIGYMCVATGTPAGFSPEDVETILVFSVQASFAMGRSQILSDLKVTRARLTQAARLATAGEVAAGVAHQINNPLTAIIAQVSLASEDMEPDTYLHERLTTIGRAATHAAHVVESMLDLGRAPETEFHPLDINESIQRALTLVQASIEPEVARIVLTLAEDLPSIEGSARDLEDAWLNLLTNARDALVGQPNGQISITTSLASSGEVVVEICDNGPGFDPDARSHAFEPFFTTKTRGTGLGLAICHDVILQHDGRIELLSEPGQGACFIVTLPAS